MTASVTMPTRMYSSGEFIAQPPFLQVFTALGKADEHQKRDNGYYNNKQIKHVVPPSSLDSWFSKLAATRIHKPYHTLL